MFDFSKHIQQKMQKTQLLRLYQSAWIFFAFAGFVVVFSIAFFIVPQFLELQRVKASILENKKIIAETNESIDKKESQLAALEEKLAEDEKKYGPRVRKAFPETEGIPELTRFLERFSVDLEKSGTMELSTISYGASDVGVDYSVLPIRLSFRASELNFVRFMRMIRQSGSIEEKDFYHGEPVRLMRIDRISISFPPPKRDENENIYAVSLEISAFYKGQKDAKIKSKKRRR